MKPILLAPSVLAADWARLEQEVTQAVEGGADWLHLDVMDGHFVPNITFGPKVVEVLRRCVKVPLDVHLMIARPEQFLEAFRNAGADIITVHQEACQHLNRTLHRIKELGAGAGVSLNPATPVDLLREVLDVADLVLIMSVNPGFGGQKFIPSSVRRIREARDLITASGRQIHLEVDGGIDRDTGPLVAEAGADVLVAGTSVFGQKNIREAVRSLKAVLAHGRS